MKVYSSRTVTFIDDFGDDTYMDGEHSRRRIFVERVMSFHQEGDASRSSLL